MGKCSSKIRWLKFDLSDEEITHVYVMVDAEGDCPIGVQGCHYKAFPARVSAIEIITNDLKDHLLWPLKAPEGG